MSNDLLLPSAASEAVWLQSISEGALRRCKRACHLAIDEMSRATIAKNVTGCAGRRASTSRQQQSCKGSGCTEYSQHIRNVWISVSISYVICGVLSSQCLVRSLLRIHMRAQLMCAP